MTNFRIYLFLLNIFVSFIEGLRLLHGTACSIIIQPMVATISQLAYETAIVVREFLYVVVGVSPALFVNFIGCHGHRFIHFLRNLTDAILNLCKSTICMLKVKDQLYLLTPKLVKSKYLKCKLIFFSYGTHNFVAQQPCWHASSG